MTHLLIDTTQKIFIGLLDENHKWIENKAIETTKSSSILHKEVYDLLRKYNTNIQSIKSLFYCSGPGSYTGMRVADGFAKVVEFSEIPLRSYYQFELPFIYGEKEGMWLSNAFKDEVFIFEWCGVKKNQLRLKTDKAIDYISQKKLPLFSYDKSFIGLEVTSSQDLIVQDPYPLSQFLIGNSELKELFYYRSIEEEFSRKKN